jgi:hypothetical protein
MQSGREIYVAFSLNFFLKHSKKKMAVILINVWNHCKILKHCCFLFFIWGLWIVFRHSPFFSTNIVFLLGWEGWKYHRLNNTPVNVVSWIDHSPSSYHLNPICKSPQLLIWQIIKRVDPHAYTCVQKRPNFLNSSPTSTQGALRAQAVRRINPTNSLCTCSFQRM